MRRVRDTGLQFPGLYLVHHNLPGKKVSWHDWTRHAVFLPLEGDLTIETEAGLLRAKPGRLIYVPPLVRMRFVSSEASGERLICLIDSAVWDRGKEHGFRAASHLAPVVCKEILFYLLLNPTSRIATTLVTTFAEVLSESIDWADGPGLLEPELFESRARDERVKKAMAILGRRSAFPVRMAQVAKEAGVSERNLSRLFTKEFGLTPTEVLTNWRISSARDLIVQGFSVGEAARRCGYKSLSSFISAFRRMAGQLPSEVARLGRKEDKTGGRTKVVSGRW